MYMLEIDMEGYFRSWTSVTLAFLGYSEKEIQAMTVFDLVKEDHLEMILEGLGERPNVEKGTTFDVSIRKGNGMWIDIHVNPEVVIEDGELKRVKCHFHTLD